MRKTVLLVASMTLALVLGSGVAMAAITATRDAGAIANAIARNTAWVTGASFVAVPSGGFPNAVSNTALTGFPTSGATYSILTTGNATVANSSNTFDANVSNGGENVRGNSDYDVTILKTDLAVPIGVNCLAIDFRFLSEEYPESLGSQFNDAFIAELDTSRWNTSGSTVDAPNNFAFGQDGKVVSINSAGSTSVGAEAAAGTVYDGATARLQAKTPITPGTHSVYLSIFDHLDGSSDSAVFIDKLNLFSVDPAKCEKGAHLDVAPPKVSGTRPMNSATGVQRNTNVVATFSEPMDASTLTKSTFKLFKVTSSGTTQVANVTVTLSADGLKATLNPFGTATTQLAKNTRYKATVTTGAKDLPGNALDQNPTATGNQQKNWTFTTGNS